MSLIPPTITRDDVLLAINEFSRKGAPEFGDSTRYDVLHDLKRYPPKAILGIAARRHLGRNLQPSEFSGGEESQCFRVLRSLGFDIVPKQPPAGWLFQANPDTFDIDGYLRVTEHPNWELRQAHYASHFELGQPVFFWRARGRADSESGIIAVGRVEGLPSMTPVDPASVPFWRNGAPQGEGLRVKLKMSSMRLDKVLKREWCTQDPVLRNLPVIRQAAGTNFPLSDELVARLLVIDEKTGRDFTETDCAWALLAYAQTIGQPISLLPGSPVAEAALRSGRVITSIYNKVLNFRSLDERDDREGMPSRSKLDELIWKRFYDESTKQIRVLELKALLQISAGPQRDASSATPIADIDEAPDDDVQSIQNAARKARKGQSKFRKNLIRIYQGVCAVTGTSVVQVLEACHISGHAESGLNRSGNGLLLRSDIHELFDEGLLTLDEHEVVHVAPELMGTDYAMLNGKKARARQSSSPIDLLLLQKRNQALSWFEKSRVSANV